MKHISDFNFWGYERWAFERDYFSVTVELEQLGQTVHVMAAFYDANGKLVGFDMVAVRRGAESVTLLSELSGPAATVRVFLTDATTDTPISQCLNWSK